MYIYLISSGAWSSYGVDALVISNKQYTVDEMATLQAEAEAEYMSNPDTFDLALFLSHKGLDIKYASGEFLYSDSYHHDFEFDIRPVRETDENAFRIGLA